MTDMIDTSLLLLTLLLVAAIYRKVKKMENVLDDLHAEVTESGTVMGSAVVLIGGLAAKLETALANNDTAAIVAIKDELKAKTDSLAAAVAANTPAAPVPVADPPIAPSA